MRNMLKSIFFVFIFSLLFICSVNASDDQLMVIEGGDEELYIIHEVIGDFDDPIVEKQTIFGSTKLYDTYDDYIINMTKNKIYVLISSISIIGLFFMIIYIIYNRR